MGATSTIAIVGGGIVGSCTAYYLAMADRAADVVVIEPDPSYEFAATPRATGTIRRTFSLPEKVAMSNYANTVYRNFADYVDVNGQPAGYTDFKRGGYLYLVSGSEGKAQIERVEKEMTATGVRAEILDSDAVKERFPEVQTDDIDFGLYSPDDGWIDPAGALQGFRGKARAMGVAYRKDRVVGINTDGRKVRSVRLESGDVLEAACVVNCANCWAPDVSNMAGMAIPVAVLRRMTYYFDTRKALPALPLIRDTKGVSVRPEGSGYLTGVTDYRAKYGFNWELDYASFEDIVWPKLANRVPSFQSLKLRRCWSGHYDMSLFDRCPFIGPWTAHLDNFYIAAGFSGHGLQHAPAAGRAISELIMTGTYQTLDLSRLSFDRVARNSRLVDEGPVS